MSLMKEDKPELQSTDSGSIYWDAVDFFSDKCVREQIKELSKIPIE